MQLLNTLLIGITAGSIYALMAIAFVLVWRSTRVVNFAQAGMALLSTYFGYEAVSRIGSFWVALPVAMIGGALPPALAAIGRVGREAAKAIPLVVTPEKQLMARKIAGIAGLSPDDLQAAMRIHGPSIGQEPKDRH